MLKVAVGSDILPAITEMDTHQTNKTAMRHSGQVAEHSGYVVYRGSVRPPPNLTAAAVPSAAVSRS